MGDRAALDRPDGPHPGPLVAALDLGTSNCRMMVAAPRRGGFRVVETFSRVVRLGEDLPLHGMLGADAMERTLDALRVCAQRLARRDVARFNAVATEACRRAPNGPAFLARIRAETGIAIRTISPREEASLVVESCTSLIRGAGRRALVFDIGGGSTEIAWVRLDAPSGHKLSAPELIAYGSFPFGVVTLPTALGIDPFTDAGFELVVRTVTDALAGFEAIHRINREIASGGVVLVGTSGTITTIAGESVGLTHYDRRAIDGTILPTADAIRAVARLRAQGRDALAHHPCITPERVDLVLPGCAVFEAIRRIWAIPQIVVADRGLREGLIGRMIRTLPAHPVADAPRPAAPSRAAPTQAAAPHAAHPEPPAAAPSPHPQLQTAT